MSFANKTMLDSEKRNSNQDYINSVKVQRLYEHDTPDCDLLESQRRKNETMLDELEDRHDYMNSTMTLAQKHNIDFVQETEYSPVKKPVIHEIDDHVDPDSLREVNTTPTFQEQNEEMTEQERLNHSHTMLTQDEKEDSFAEDQDNKFNLKLHKCDQNAKIPIKSVDVESSDEEDEDEDDEEEQQMELFDSPEKIQLSTQKRSDAFGSVNSLAMNKPSSYALSDDQMQRIQELKQK